MSENTVYLNVNESETLLKNLVLEDTLSFERAKEVCLSSRTICDALIRAIFSGKYDTHAGRITLAEKLQLLVNADTFLLSTAKAIHADPATTFTSEGLAILPKETLSRFNNCKRLRANPEEIEKIKKLGRGDQPLFFVRNGTLRSKRIRERFSAIQLSRGNAEVWNSLLPESVPGLNAGAGAEIGLLNGSGAKIAGWNERDHLGDDANNEKRKLLRSIAIQLRSHYWDVTTDKGPLYDCADQLLFQANHLERQISHSARFLGELDAIRDLYTDLISSKLSDIRQKAKESPSDFSVPDQWAEYRDAFHKVAEPLDSLLLRFFDEYHPVLVEDTGLDIAKSDWSDSGRITRPLSLWKTSNTEPATEQSQTSKVVPHSSLYLNEPPHRVVMGVCDWRTANREVDSVKYPDFQLIFTVNQRDNVELTEQILDLFRAYPPAASYSIQIEGVADTQPIVVQTLDELAYFAQSAAQMPIYQKLEIYSQTEDDINLLVGLDLLPWSTGDKEIIVWSDCQEFQLAPIQKLLGETAKEPRLGEELGFSMLRSLLESAISRLPS